MIPSPLQLKSYFFTKVSVEMLKVFADPEARTFTAMDFDFNGVDMRTETSVVLASGQSNDPKDFMITFKLSIPNLDGVLCPYTIDVGIVGTFQVSDEIDKEDREDIVEVNGTSILYGCVCEIVSTLTSRALPGMLMLPTAEFTD